MARGEEAGCGLTRLGLEDPVHHWAAGWAVELSRQAWVVPSGPGG